MQSQPKGVGGWLLFLIVILTILTPLGGIGQTYGELADIEIQTPQLVGTAIWANFKVATWAFTLLQISVLFAAGYRLATLHEPSTVRFAIAMFWIGGPILSLVSFLAISAITNVNVFSGVESAGVIGSLIGQIFWAAVWTAYLLRSRRVRNTYINSHFPKA